jgi:hypothetical protein
MRKASVSIIVILLCLIGCSAYVLQSNGMPGYTGSPGESTCNSCHSGGNSSTSGITITAVPAFTLNEYLPDSTYKISIDVSASGFSRYGFACEILDSVSKNCGNMFDAGSGVKFQNAFNARRNAVHTSAKTGTMVSFTFSWTAPPSGKAIIYAAANAVNGNNSTSGDFPLAKHTMTLMAAAPVTPTIPSEPVDTTKKTDVGINEHVASALKLNVFPNPANGFTNLNYTLVKNTLVTGELISLDGKVVKSLVDARQNPGEHNQILVLSDIPPGVYFLKISLDGKHTSQKLISVR